MLKNPFTLNLTDVAVGAFLEICFTDLEFPLWECERDIRP